MYSLYIFGALPSNKTILSIADDKGVRILNFLENLQYQHFSKHKNNGSKIIFNIS